jgi:murein DD-endopeptidase MepM/ murein hydrolase activator NlpD
VRGRLVAAGSTLVALALPALAAADGSAAGAGFELRRANASPAKAFFDGERRIRLRYAFAAERRLDLVIRVVRRRDGRAVRRWTERDVVPGTPHLRRWDGRRANGRVPADGRYEFVIGPRGRDGVAAADFSFHDHVFPVDGPHRYGDRFGEPRSGGRVHEGQDLPARCGTPLRAARGGRLQARGYSDALYGHWALIDGRATDHDHFYAHLVAPTPLRDHARVRTGERIGSVGKTGNARSEFCQLHFELWPEGYRHDRPRDPLASLRRWDDFS